MSYSNFPQYEYEASDYSKTNYLRFQEGVPTTVRIISEGSRYVAKHFLTKIRTSILCLGEQCPICERNKTLREQHGRNANKQSDYIAIQNRNMLNVLDRTLVIVDEETGDEYSAHKGTFPTITKDGKRSLIDVTPQPSNSIKVLERGKRLFEQFDVNHNEYQHLGGIRGFDIKLVTMGAGKTMSISVVPLPERNDDITELLEGLEEPVLEDLGIQLSPDEVLEAASGVTLRDIYAARKSDETESDTSAVDAELVGSLADVEESVSDLFEN
ncbi:hypothetical protein LCGC14_0680260 [marine sediment metagenome]|uniref:Bacteriophage T4 Gp32 single-stranded DNA-binding domain-containing protein n=1 Tax=marine sediment metagenome TaxID=412755 RepID=A0A0F9TWE5_9ZZZZ